MRNAQPISCGGPARVILGLARQRRGHPVRPMRRSRQVRFCAAAQDCFACACNLALAMTNEGKARTKEREAERRQTRSPIVRIIGCGRVLGGARSPVGVPPRLLLEMSEHLRPASGQASWDAAATIILLGGRYPPLPVPVQCAPHGRPRITGDMMPKAAREQFARLPAGTALAPYVGSHPDTSRNERAGLLYPDQ